MTDLQRYASATERRIASRLVNAATRKGYLISVNDGGGWVVRKSASGRKVLDALASTSDDQLVLHNANGERVGWVWLIWGNGEDLISDYTDNAAMGELVAVADPDSCGV